MDKDLFRHIISSIQYRFNLDEDKASEADILDKIKKGVEFKGLNLWTLIFAIFIASIGLNVNSTAVIIGAMLISPLMGPIIGIGMGAGVFDFELIKKAGKNLFIASVIGLLTSTLYFAISPLSNAQSELLARTSPTIWDVLIAFFGGLAGIVANSRKKFNNVIPGVAIATALMPPLCTAGFGLATGQWSFFFGAFYLYLINSVFISISTFLIVRFLKFEPVSYVNTKTAAKVKKWVITIALLTIIPSLYLAYIFVQNEIFVKNANHLINEEIPSINYTIINKNINPDNKQITLTIIGDANNDSLSNIIELKKSKYGLENTKILIKNSVSNDKPNEDLNELKEGIIEEMFVKQENELKLKSQEIKQLEKKISSLNEFDLKREQAIDEFYALYGKPQELIIERSINHKPNDIDTNLIVLFKTSSDKFTEEKLNEMENWMQVKFGIKKIKIIKE